MLLGQKYFCDEMIKTKQYVRDGTTSSVEKSKLPQRRMNKFFRCVNHSGYKYRKIYRISYEKLKTYDTTCWSIQIIGRINMKKKQCLNQEHVTHLQLMIKEKTLCDDNCPFSIDLREKQSIAVSHLWMPIGNNWTNWLMQ